MLNQVEVQHQWPIIREKILKHWTRLNSEEIDQTHGDLAAIMRLVKKHYGAIEEFEEDFEDICSYCELRCRFNEKH